MPAEMFAETLAQFRRVSFASREAMTALASLGSRSAEISCDKQGRFAIPAKLLAHAGIEDKTLLVGTGSLIQIWQPERWEVERLDTDTSLDVVEAMHSTPGMDFESAFKRMLMDDKS